MENQVKTKIIKEISWLTLSLMFGLFGAGNYHSLAESARAERERVNPYSYTQELREREKQKIMYNTFALGIAAAGFSQLTRKYVSGRLARKIN